MLNSVDERSQNEVVLKFILEHVYAKAEWPLLRDLHRRIHRELDTPFDVREVIPRLVSSTITPHWTLQERIMLPLSTFRKRSEAAPLLRALASFIAYAVVKYRSSNDDVEVTQEEAERVLDVGGRELQLLPLFLLRESFVWRGHQDTEAGWVIEISDEIVRMRDVVDVETYLEVTDELRANAEHEQAAAASAHYEMIRATTPQPSADIGLEGPKTRMPGPPQTEGIMARHRRGIVQFGVAVAASLVAAGMWALLGGFFDTQSDVTPDRTKESEVGVSSPPATASGTTSPAGSAAPRTAGDIGESVRLGCPSSPRKGRDAPRLEIRVVKWCATFAVRGQAQFKFKVWVRNSGHRRLDISLGHWYLLLDRQRLGRWTPPRIGTAAAEEPFQTTVRQHSVWAIPANPERVYDLVPRVPGSGTFATHWNAPSLPPGSLWDPVDDQHGTLVFYVPLPPDSKLVLDNEVGIGYLMKRRVVALCPPRKWGPRVHPREF